MIRLSNISKMSTCTNVVDFEKSIMHANLICQILKLLDIVFNREDRIGFSQVCLKSDTIF